MPFSGGPQHSIEPGPIRRKSKLENTYWYITCVEHNSYTRTCSLFTVHSILTHPGGGFHCRRMEHQRSTETESRMEHEGLVHPRTTRPTKKSASPLATKIKEKNTPREFVPRTQGCTPRSPVSTHFASFFSLFFHSGVSIITHTNRSARQYLRFAIMVMMPVPIPLVVTPRHKSKRDLAPLT